MSVGQSSLIMLDRSMVVPGVMVQRAQKRGTLNLIAGGKPKNVLNQNVQKVYINGIRYRGLAKASREPGNELPSVSFNTTQKATNAYWLSTSTKYSVWDDDNAKFSGLNAPQIQNMIAHGAIADLTAILALYGTGEGMSEGIMNSPGVFEENLPADSNGALSLRTYDAGEFAQYFLQLTVDAETRMLTVGLDREQVLNVLMPQRVLGYLRRSSVIKLTSGIQRDGGGVHTIEGRIQAVATSPNGNISINFYVDDTLIGKGAGGSDAVVMCYPGFPDTPDDIYNTDALAALPNSIQEMVAMYTAHSQPMEIESPAVDGSQGVYTTYHTKVTPGWALRPEAVTILSLPYDEGN